MHLCISFLFVDRVAPSEILAWFFVCEKVKVLVLKSHSLDKISLRYYIADFFD